MVTDSDTNTQFVNNELLLTVKEGVQRNDVETFVANHGGKIVGYDKFLNKYQIQLNATYSLNELEKVRTEYDDVKLFTKR